MTVRTITVVLALLAFCGISNAKEERWLNFAEDADLKYYLDPQSIHSLPDNVYLFWVKSVAKDRTYFKREYNLSNLSYIFTNYELDCAVSSYRIRGSIMYDKNRREISKSLAASDPVFEPVPPESMVELAQQEVCAGFEKTAEAEDDVAAPVAPAAQATPPAPAALPTLSAELGPADGATTAEPAAPNEPETTGESAAKIQPAAKVDPAPQSEPISQTEPVAQKEQMTHAEPVAQTEPVIQTEPVAQTEPITQAVPVAETGGMITIPAAPVRPAASAQPVIPEHISAPFTKGG